MSSMFLANALNALVNASFILIGLTSSLVAALIAMKLALLAWEEITRRSLLWMKPAFEDCLKKRAPAPPAAFRRLRWPRRSILQYLIIYRSFGHTGRGLQSIAGAYESLGFIETDLKRLRSWFWWVRAEGARCLGQMRSRRAKARLLESLGDRSVPVRLMSAWALGRIGDADSIERILEALVGSSRIAGMRLSSTVFELGEKAVRPLMQCLAHPDYRIRLLVIHLLGELKDPRSLPAILSRTEPKEHKEVRVAAYKALGTIAHPSAVPALARGLKDMHWEVRAQAARGLGEIGAPRAAKMLRRALEDPKWWVRRNAGEALTKIKPEGEKMLLEAYRKSSRSPARDMAEQWLDEIGSLPSIS
ncbi:MAG: HEAT repeat domain-containing protein [Elusimicrobia bacterium]|nr:HEAT repeat domain-containing protein [Elusimicrobiota bacterium]